MICAFLKSSSNTWLCIYCWIKTNKMELRRENPSLIKTFTRIFVQSIVLKLSRIWVTQQFCEEYSQNSCKQKNAWATIILALEKMVCTVIWISSALWWLLVFFSMNYFIAKFAWKLVGNGHNQVDCVKLDEYCKYN